MSAYASPTFTAGTIACETNSSIQLPPDITALGLLTQGVIQTTGLSATYPRVLF
jgi:hypothetical protein